MVDAMATTSDERTEPQDVEWLVRQLEQWPTRVHQERTTNIGYLMKEAAKEIRRLTALTEAGPDLSNVTGPVKLAHLMAWHHFGMRWETMEPVSQRELTAACQAAYEWLNRPIADRHAALAVPPAGMTALEAQALRVDQYVTITEETSGEGADGRVRTHPAGTVGQISRIRTAEMPYGLTITVIIGPQSGNEAIVNAFDEADLIFPFAVAELV